MVTVSIKWLEYLMLNLPVGVLMFLGLWVLDDF